MYHHAKFHADQCHNHRYICNWKEEKTQQPVYPNIWRVNIFSNYNDLFHFLFCFIFVPTISAFTLPNFHVLTCYYTTALSLMQLWKYK